MPVPIDGQDVHGGNLTSLPRVERSSAAPSVAPVSSSLFYEQLQLSSFSFRSWTREEYGKAPSKHPFPLPYTIELPHSCFYASLPQGIVDHHAFRDNGVVRDWTKKEEDQERDMALQPPDSWRGRGHPPSSTAGIQSHTNTRRMEYPMISSSPASPLSGHRGRRPPSMVGNQEEMIGSLERPHPTPQMQAEGKRSPPATPLQRGIPAGSWSGKTLPLARQPPFPADLQIEYFSSGCLRFLLYMWYALCVIAFILIWIPAAQWKRYQLSKQAYTEGAISTVQQQWKYYSMTSEEGIRSERGRTMEPSVLWEAVVPPSTSTSFFSLVVWRERRLEVHLSLSSPLLTTYCTESEEEAEGQRGKRGILAFRLRGGEATPRSFQPKKPNQITQTAEQGSGEAGGPSGIVMDNTAGSLPSLGSKKWTREWTLGSVGELPPTSTMPIYEEGGGGAWVVVVPLDLVCPRPSSSCRIQVVLSGRQRETRMEDGNTRVRYSPLLAASSSSSSSVSLASNIMDRGKKEAHPDPLDSSCMSGPRCRERRDGVLLSQSSLDVSKLTNSSRISLFVVSSTSSYTIFMLTFRLVLLVITLWRLVVYVGVLRWSRATPEQLAIFFSLISLVLYLNPLFPLAVVSTSTQLALSFMEMDFPYVFFTQLTLLVIYLMLCCLPWRAVSAEEESKAKDKRDPTHLSSRPISSASSSAVPPLAASASGSQGRKWWSWGYWSDPEFPSFPPRWVSVVYVGIMVVIGVLVVVHGVTLDPSAGFFSFASPPPVSSFSFWSIPFRTCSTPTVTMQTRTARAIFSRGVVGSGDAHQKTPLVTIIQYIIEGNMVLTCVITGVLYFILPRYFDYSLIRPRWLALCFLKRFFFPFILVLLGELLAFNVYYPLVLPSYQSRQPLNSISAICVGTGVVHLLVASYTGTLRPATLPVDASDPRWKHIVWPEEWLAMLHQRGTGQYIFFSEEEKRAFIALQQQYHPAHRRKRSSGPEERTGRLDAQPPKEKHKRPHPRFLSFPSPPMRAAREREGPEPPCFHRMASAATTGKKQKGRSRASSLSPSDSESESFPVVVVPNFQGPTGWSVMEKVDPKKRVVEEESPEEAARRRSGRRQGGSGGRKPQQDTVLHRPPHRRHPIRASTQKNKETQEEEGDWGVSTPMSQHNIQEEPTGKRDHHERIQLSQRGGATRCVVPSPVPAEEIPPPPAAFLVDLTHLTPALSLPFSLSSSWKRPGKAVKEMATPISPTIRRRGLPALPYLQNGGDGWMGSYAVSTHRPSPCREGTYDATRASFSSAVATPSPPFATDAVVPPSRMRRHDGNERAGPRVTRNSSVELDLVSWWMQACLQAVPSWAAPSCGGCQAGPMKGLPSRCPIPTISSLFTTRANSERDHHSSEGVEAQEGHREERSTQEKDPKQIRSGEVPGAWVSSSEWARPLPPPLFGGILLERWKTMASTTTREDNGHIKAVVKEQGWSPFFSLTSPDGTWGTGLPRPPSSSSVSALSRGLTRVLTLCVRLFLKGIAWMFRGMLWVSHGCYANTLKKKPVRRSTRGELHGERGYRHGSATCASSRVRPTHVSFPVGEGRKADIPNFFVLETAIDACNLSFEVYKPLKPARLEDVDRMERLHPQMSTATMLDVLPLPSSLEPSSSHPESLSIFQRTMTWSKKTWNVLRSTSGLLFHYSPHTEEEREREEEPPASPYVTVEGPEPRGETRRAEEPQAVPFLSVGEGRRPSKGGASSWPSGLAPLRISSSPLPHLLPLPNETGRQRPSPALLTPLTVGLAPSRTLLDWEGTPRDTPAHPFSHIPQVEEPAMLSCRTPTPSTQAEEDARSIPAEALVEPEDGWMNVAQYGYVLRCVKLVKKVQFLIAVLDTSLPFHKGKPPRIVISFRGTSRMSNVKKDSAFWNVPWSEARPEEEKKSPKTTAMIPMTQWELSDASPSEKITGRGASPTAGGATRRKPTRGAAMREMDHDFHFSVDPPRHASRGGAETEAAEETKRSTRPAISTLPGDPRKPSRASSVSLTTTESTSGNEDESNGREEARAEVRKITVEKEKDESNKEVREKQGAACPFWKIAHQLYGDDENDENAMPSVAAGFLSLWESLRRDVRKKLRLVERDMDARWRRRKDEKNRAGEASMHHAAEENAADTSSEELEVLITGHSLGGALAVLCAYHLSRWFHWRGGKKPKLLVYTFGQPRVGDMAFERSYDHYVPHSFQVTNESDLVSAVCGGFSGGTRVQIDRYGNFTVQPSPVEAVVEPLKGKGLSLVHHLLTNYAVALNAMADRSGGVCKPRVNEPYHKKQELNSLSVR